MPELPLFSPMCVAALTSKSQFTRRTRKSWKAFWFNQTGRKSGVLSQITDNWLKAAPSGLKRVVGQELNKLKAHVEAQLKKRVKSKPPRIKQQAHDKIDLSLPGMSALSARAT